MKLNNNEFEGYLVSEALDLPHYRAFFLVTSHPLNWFVDTVSWSLTDTNYKYVKFGPHINSFTYHSQLETVNLLRTATDWHQLLLSQSCSTLPVIDCTANLGIDPERIATADRWIRGFRAWNAE
jgi:hypothetical protein